MKILGDERLATSDWLEMIQRRYENRLGKPSTWYFASRTGKRAAVLVVPLTEQTGKVVLVRQYRVVLDAWVLEFPAGLVDDGEGLETAARRELVEETGYEGEIVSIGPPVPTSPGMTDELVSIVTMRVGEAPARPAAPEASEEIEVLALSMEELGTMIGGAATASPRLVIDSRLYAWWLGRMYSGSNA